MRYVPVSAVRDVGDLEFGVTRAVLFEDAIAVEFQYYGVGDREPWHGLDFELTDLATGRRLRPSGGGRTGDNAASHGEGWWEDLGEATQLRLRTNSMSDVIVDLAATVAADEAIEVGVRPDDVRDGDSPPELRAFQRHSGPLRPDRARAIKQSAVHHGAATITPIALVEWGSVIELVAGHHPDDADARPPMFPPRSWDIVVDGQRLAGAFHLMFSHRCRCEHMHGVVSVLATREPPASVHAPTDEIAPRPSPVKPRRPSRARAVPDGGPVRP